MQQLESFVREPFPVAFIFHGPTGVGKTCAARALANDLGCDQQFPELGGLSEIPSGKQDGRAQEKRSDAAKRAWQTMRAKGGRKAVAHA